jgi:2-C-methyl-D-erythritol 4-phosphate cytidylyltransferase/2-C-methyl-D-erythritol 2,4-cyclodiphosphate synthase
VLAACPVVDGLVAVVPPGEEARAEAELAGLGKAVRAVGGAPTRAGSVWNGLAAADAPVVLVHDAARPFASPELAARVAEAAARDGAALAALPVTDTVKQRAEGSEPPRVAATLDRRALWLAQTPQGFRRALLLSAYAAAGEGAADATDECALVERMGAPVTLVPGEAGNFKITGPEDVARARALTEPAPVAVGEPPAFAVGVGYDTHRFAAGRTLVLGGVEFEGDGLLGHSDADAAAHAIGDAVLGAAGLGDLGRHFPDTDPRWKGVSSLALLREIVRLAGERGLRVGNADVTLAAKRPKIAPRAEEMRARLAEALGISASQVNVKATTGEGMGFVGRGEGIAAHAVALLWRVGR